MWHLSGSQAFSRRPLNAAACKAAVRDWLQWVVPSQPSSIVPLSLCGASRPQTSPLFPTPLGPVKRDGVVSTFIAVGWGARNLACL